MATVIFVPAKAGVKPFLVRVPRTADLEDKQWWPVLSDYQGKEPLMVCMCGDFDDCNIMFDEASTVRNGWFKPKYEVYGDALIFMQSAADEETLDLAGQLASNVLEEICEPQWCDYM